MVNLTAVQKLKIPVIFEIRVDSEQINRIQLELELFSEFLVLKLDLCKGGDVPVHYTASACYMLYAICYMLK